MQRRSWLTGAGSVLALGSSLSGRARAAGAALDLNLPEGARDEAVLATLEGKKPLIRLTARPPNYESPLSAFALPITPNDQFFVRYHLSQIPLRSSVGRWTLKIGGDAAGRAVELSHADLARLPQQELAAVCQCSGNRRGFATPHVPGVQWGAGAMGCALWRGPRLRDVLALAGLGSDAVEVAVSGADAGVMPGTPAFIKSLPVERAMHDDTLVALAMNDTDLPIWNGHPARLVVAGWTATYWMKHLASIEIRSKPLDNFWMKSAYRVPAGLFAGSAFPTQDNAATQPITDILVNVLATSHADGEPVRGAGFTLAGQAWDNGAGIDRVEVSITRGATWGAAMLGPVESRYAFRPWSIQIAASPGPLSILIRATSKSGAVQPGKAVANPSGYHHNAIQTLTVLAA